MKFIANIPKNRNLKKRGDVQNVITSVILQQYDMFLEGRHLRRRIGKYQVVSMAKKEMVDDTLNVLCVNNCIKWVSE